MRVDNLQSDPRRGGGRPRDWGVIETLCVMGSQRSRQERRGSVLADSRRGGLGAEQSTAEQRR